MTNSGQERQKQQVSNSTIRTASKGAEEGASFFRVTDFDAQGRQFTVDPAIPPRAASAGEAQDQDADLPDGGWASASPRDAGRGLVALEQVAVRAQERVWAYRQKELPQLHQGEVVEQAGEDSAVGVFESGLADLALQDQQLVPQRPYRLCLPVAHRQQTQEADAVGRSKIGQAQQHDRS